MKLTKRLVGTAVLAAGLIAAACSEGNHEADPVGPGQAMGPGISVAEALNSSLSSPLLVNGFLVATESEVRLCDSLAESQPPRCAGASLVVAGLDISTVPAVTTDGGVQWTEAATQVLGTVDSGTLTIESTSLASSS